MAQTPEQRAYNKEIKRLINLNLQLSNEGYAVDLPDYVRRKTNPTKEDVQRLKQLTREKLMETALAKEANAIMENVTDAAARDFRETIEKSRIYAEESKELNKYNNQLYKGADRKTLNTHTLAYAQASKERRDKAMQKIDEAEKKYGIEEIAKRFKKNADRLQDIINEIIYGSDDEDNQVKNAMMELESILKDEAVSMKESEEIEEDNE